MSRDDRDKRVSFALLEGHKSDSHLLGSKSSSAKMGRDVPGSTLARSKSSRNKVQSSAGSKSGKSARRRQGDFNLYARSPTFQIEQAMSRLEIARAYGQSASERNKNKGGTQPKKEKSVRRTRSAGDTLCSKSTPENLVIQDNSGMFSSKGASYFDDSDNDICLQDWFHSSAGTLDNDPRDSRDTVSPASGQDPNLMSSACISELLTDGTERVDRGVQTCAEIGGSLVSRRKKEKGPGVDRPSGGSTELTMEESEGVDIQDNPNELDLKKRVEGLRQSVAAMRSEARMLKLHTEEQVLLKELGALTSYVKNTRKILSGVESRPEFFDSTKTTPPACSDDTHNLDTEIAHPKISTHQQKVTDTNVAGIGRGENNASSLDHHVELEFKRTCACQKQKDDQCGLETDEAIAPGDRMSVCVCSTASESFKKHHIHVRHSDFGMDEVGLVSEEIEENGGCAGQNGRIVGWEQDSGSSSMLQTRQDEGDADHQLNGNTQDSKTCFLARENSENQCIHPELEEDCEGHHPESGYPKCSPEQFAIENHSKADASPRNIKSNGMYVEELVEDPADYSQHLSSTVYNHKDSDDEVGWENGEQDPVVSLEELSAQMMYRMHGDQLNRAFDDTDVPRFADVHRDMNMASDAEQMSDDSDVVNAHALHDDSGLILADLEGILEKEVAREASGESDSVKSLDTSRTWRLDFDIHDDNASNIITDSEAEEYLNALESNRESVSSRELVTRTDPDYVAALVEEMMSAFLTNAPEYSQICTAPVPGRVFMELQIARKPNKDQSIFDRCIFETMNEIISDTYRMCNRIGGFRNDDEDCIPLPPKHTWIYDTKDKILRAINHRTVHFDAIGTVLAQDAWSFHNSVMQIDDEINQLRSKLV